jgi:hypothetical protein
MSHTSARRVREGVEKQLYYESKYDIQKRMGGVKTSLNYSRFIY